MDVSTDSAFIDAVASESGLVAVQSQLTDSAVTALLEQFYGLKVLLYAFPRRKTRPSDSAPETRRIW